MTYGRLVVKATRHKSGSWSLYITYPDGSWEHRRGLLDYGYAEDAAREAIAKAEAMLDSDPAVCARGETE